MEFKLDSIKKENYQRAFFFKKIGFLQMDLVLEHYKSQDFLAIYSDEQLGTYISKKAAEKAGNVGKLIFSDRENFKIFESGFRQVIKELGKYINHAKNLKKVTIRDINDWRAINLKQYYYYEKTEFFYTDACYHGEMSEILKKNLLILGEDLKMVSRPLLVELQTSVIYHLLDLISKDKGISTDDLNFYSIDELIALLETGQRPAPGNINDRKKSYVFYCNNNCKINIDGKDKDTIIERFREKDFSNVDEFKGTIASKGKVTARVRVILAELNIPYEQFVKKLHAMEFNQGEILVTETTSPDFMPLLKKAGGIIADQGGLNSHAAIISREFNVPCLVGTYHATKILRTGDLVELDANTGMVKIVEKSK